MKGDAWEGGHRMPLIARWPGRVRAKTVNEELVSLTDLVATVRGLLRIDTAAGADGVDFSPALLGKPWRRPGTHPVVARSSMGATALRIGSLAWIDRLGSGGFSDPQQEKPVKGGPAVQLHDLQNDPGQKTNLAADPRNAGKLREFADILRRLTTERPPAPRP
jgi:arylsulfatase A-like enzyme